MEKPRKRHIGIGFAGTVHAEPCAFHLHLAKHHLWVGYKIAVHRDAVFICVKVYPLWFNVNYAVTLLKDKDVARDLRACVCPKCVVGKPYRT